jgi:hypothetical protein
MVCDVENGDLTPEQAPDWVYRQRARGIIPSVYCNQSTWPAVKAAFTARNIPQPYYWIANYSNGPLIPTGASAIQYQNNPGYDVSNVAPIWPTIDGLVKPTPAPDRLIIGQVLKAGQHLTSQNGVYELAMQHDGNLVVYKDLVHPIWSSKTNDPANAFRGDRVAMQSDGNLVIYGRSNPVWATMTQNRGGNRVVMQNDGNLVIYSGTDKPVWDSGPYIK